MTRPLAGLARGVGAAARFIPGAGLIAAGGMAAYDAYSGYKDAGKNLGISGRQATTGEKLSSAAGSALSGLTFGLISPETISKSIAKATGAGPGASSSQDAAKEAQKKHEAQMAATDQSKEKTEASIVTTQSKIEPLQLLSMAWEAAAVQVRLALHQMAEEAHLVVLALLLQIFLHTWLQLLCLNQGVMLMLEQKQVLLEVCSNS